MSMVSLDYKASSIRGYTLSKNFNKSMLSSSISTEFISLCTVEYLLMWRFQTVYVEEFTIGLLLKPYIDDFIFNMSKWITLLFNF